MKKIIALLLVAVMCFSLAACGGDKETSNNTEPQTNETTNNEAQKTDLLGVWEDCGIVGATLTLNEDGTGCFSSFENFEGMWEITDNLLVLKKDNSLYQFEIVEENDIISLVIKEGVNDDDWIFKKENDWKAEKAEYVGIWACEDKTLTLTLNEDGTWSKDSKEGKGWYIDDELGRLCLNDNGGIYTEGVFVYEDDTLHYETANGEILTLQEE